MATGISGASWADYDRDNDLDLLLAGQSSTGVTTRLYRNDNGTFTDVNAGITGLFRSPAPWGDYDQDGDPDLLLAGEGGVQLYRSEEGAFGAVFAGLPSLAQSASAWGDYDNDGDLDLLLAGVDGGNNEVTRLYRNNNGSFTDANASLAGVRTPSIAWGDYDSRWRGPPMDW